MTTFFLQIGDRFHVGEFTVIIPPFAPKRKRAFSLKRKYIKKDRFSKSDRSENRWIGFCHP